jgi:1-deoxy-D-xylulose-5-phosphate synthase
MAAGMAKAGLKPVVSIYSTFLQRAMDQIIHDVAILNLPVLFGIDRGGIVEDGETHQGVFDIAFLRSIPNFTVLAPKDANELRDMVFTALKTMKGPTAIRFPRDKAVNADHIDSHSFQTVNYGSWEVLHSPQLRIQHSAVILAYGSMVDLALQALPLMQAKGLDSKIVNARSAKPLDQNMLKELAQDPATKIVTLEEGCLPGGFGASVLEWASAQRFQSPEVKLPEIACLGVPDNFIEHGSRAILLDRNGLSPEKVAEFVLKFSSSF